MHPYLGAIAAVASRWLALPAFHGAGVVIDGRAWGVLGGPGAGKSTFAAKAALEGLGVLSDDLLVVRDGVVPAGPRCVDLRQDAATALGVGETIGVAGVRERWRFRLPGIAPEAPLGGWIVLGWGDAAEIRLVDAPTRVRRLLEHLAIVPGPPNPADLLDLSARPMLELLRPRELEHAHDGLQLVVDAAADPALLV